MTLTKTKTALLPILSAAVLMTAACSGPIKGEASYPTRVKGTDKILYSDEKRDTIWGEGETLGSRLFGEDKDRTAGTGIGVNSYLWRASLDTVSFMPVTSADPFGGVILTDWYENPAAAGERYKLNIYILDKQLRADGVRVAMFKQERSGNGWRDTAVSESARRDVEDAILTRARQLRTAQTPERK